MDYTDVILDSEATEQLNSDFFNAVPEWAQDVILRATDLDTGIASEITWTPQGVKHLKAAISCSKAVNRKMENDLAYGERNNLFVGEVKSRKKRKVHGKVHKTKNPKVRVEDNSRGKQRKTVK